MSQRAGVDYQRHEELWEERHDGVKMRAIVFLFDNVM